MSFFGIKPAKPFSAPVAKGPPVYPAYDKRPPPPPPVYTPVTV